jgi:SWI/SNF-related matrix-associated actin-dependent regulator of chromatin subfamily A-like protein 1
MKLEYVDGTKLFVLWAERGSKPSPDDLVKEYGWDFSVPRSTPAVACLFTSSPYVAAPFAAHGTAGAIRELEWVTKAVDESSRQESDAHIKHPPDRELWGFQKASCEYLLRRGGGLDADQPGLGKTPTAICFANEIKAKRILVICPASIRLQWAARIREWTTMPWPYTIYPILNGARGVHPTAHWTIVSYDLARTPAIGAALAQGKYDLLILDEAHMLKTPDSNRTRAIFGDYQTGGYRRKGSHEPIFNALASRAGSVVALTGTPLPNRPREAYTLGRSLCWDAYDWLSEDAFGERFNPRVKRTGERKDGSTFVYIDERTGRHQELQYRMRANFMVRHLKREVMGQLKMPVYDLIRVEKTGAVKAALEAESLLGIDPENLDVNNISILGHVSAVRKQMGIAIAPQVVDWVNMLIEGGEEKLVVFAWHIEVLNIFEKAFQKHGVLRIDGSVGAVMKQKTVDDFVKDPTKQILIGNMQAMGLGTDGLQKVSCHALIAEADWVPGNNEQAVDRLDRGGQSRTVQADIFVAPDSICEKVLASALKKAHNVHRSLDRRYKIA